jgi:hypothetical protein
MEPNNNALAAFQPNSTPTTQPQPPAQVRRVSENVSMTDFNDAAVSKYEFELYSGKVGEIHHIQLLLPGPSPISKGRSHFHEKLKSGGILCRSVYTLSPDGKQEILTEERNCCKWLGSSSPRFAALVIQYGTTSTGEIAQPFKYSLKVWRFGVDKFKNLQQINRDFPLTKHDLSVSCTDNTYQKLVIGAKSTCLLNHPNFPDKNKQDILAWATASVGKLPNELGRKFTDDNALFAHLQANGIIVGGQPAGPVPTMLPSDQPVTNFEDIIGTVTNRS